MICLGPAHSRRAVTYTMIMGHSPVFETHQKTGSCFCGAVRRRGYDSMSGAMKSSSMLLFASFSCSRSSRGGRPTVLDWSLNVWRFTRAYARLTLWLHHCLCSALFAVHSGTSSASPPLFQRLDVAATLAIIQTSSFFNDSDTLYDRLFLFNLNHTACLHASGPYPLFLSPSTFTLFVLPPPHSLTRCRYRSVSRRSYLLHFLGIHCPTPLGSTSP